MAKRLTFQQLEVFRAVMEVGTTTQAARLLRTTQPSISRRLADLRRAVGFPLFEMQSGRLRPTREARQLHRSVQRHFDGLALIEREAQSLRRSGAGPLRIGSTSTLAAGLLPRIIARFQSSHPESAIVLHTLPTPQLEALLRQDQIDLMRTTGDVDESAFEISILDTAQAVCIMAHDHPAARADHVGIETLRESRLVLLNDADNIVMRLREALGEDDASDAIAVQTNSSITICALVAAGVGVGVVNPFVANAFATSLEIRPLRPAIEIAVRLARSPAAPPSLLETAFRALLTAQPLSA